MNNQRLWKLSFDFLYRIVQRNETELEIITLCNCHFIGDTIKMVVKEDIIGYFLQRNNKNVQIN